MSYELPLWGSGVTYSARLDRRFLEQTFRGTERVLSGFVATERAAGANNEVEVAAGFGVVLGDDIQDQGAYFIENTETKSVTMPAAPVSDQRVDWIVAQVVDPEARGTVGVDTYGWSFVVVEGVASSSPAPPSLPASAIPIASVLRTASESAVRDDAISDLRELGEYPYGVGTAVPSGPGIDGDLYVRTA